MFPYNWVVPLNTPPHKALLPMAMLKSIPPLAPSSAPLIALLPIAILWDSPPSITKAEFWPIIVLLLPAWLGDAFLPNIVFPTPASLSEILIPSTDILPNEPVEVAEPLMFPLWTFNPVPFGITTPATVFKFILAP